MKKIIIPANSVLRNRKDFTPLEKTAIHRYHHQTRETWGKWWAMLDETERAFLSGKGWGETGHKKSPAESGEA